MRSMSKENASQTDLQLQRLADAEPDHIASGTRIPDRLIDQYLRPHTWVFNFGGGNGGKHPQVTDIVLEINERSVNNARHHGFAYETDATRFEIPKFSFGSLMYLENVDGVFMEGFLCNLMRKGPRRAFAAAHMHLAPNGLLMIADNLRADQFNPVLAETLGEEELVHFRDQWEARYRANKAIGLPYGTFRVAKPGPLKDYYDFAPPEVLETIEPERTARHFTEKRLFDLAEQFEFDLVTKEYAVWHSRMGHPLSGIVLVFRKRDLYYYHPQYSGLTDEQATIARKSENLPPYEEGVQKIRDRIQEPAFHMPSLFSKKSPLFGKKW